MINAWPTLRALSRPSGVIGAITEAGWISAHLLLYPWGARREAAVRDHLRLDDVDPITRPDPARGRFPGRRVPGHSPHLRPRRGP